MPLLLRQSLRSSLNVPKSSTGPLAQSTRRRSAGRNLVSPSRCLRCQLRAHARFYTNANKKPDNSHGDEDKGANTSSIPKESGNAALESHPRPDAEPKENLSDDLPSLTEGRRSNLSKRFSQVMDNLQSNVFVAGQRLNDLTGYSGIEAMKTSIEEQEQLVQTTRVAVRDAKAAYTSAIALRSTSQREVNELLQRKHAWTPTDLERFTSLYRSDHANEQAESQAQAALAAAERVAEEAGTRLGKSILARYHEEQIWSDKIRRMSTWGTWGLMGVNVLLFLVFQVAVEPWRRARLVRGFEEKVMEVLEKENVSPAVEEAVEKRQLSEEHSLEVDPAVMAAVEEVEREEMQSTSPQLQDPAPVKDVLSPGFESYKEAFREMFSERKVTLSQKDVTTVALEGAAAGAALMGLLLVALRPK